MIRHCVFIRFRPEVTNAEREAIHAEIAALRDRLPGFLAVHIGVNVSPETGMDKGYGEGFIADFADAAARDAYLDDAEHQKTGAKIVAAAQGGVQGVFVYDLELPD
ncbi:MULTISPECIES: Dabb family protein [unclassified Sinorhizobium]|uniref:Dabb family protein n=1 Tax=unclassified Sinorhizobium TaxID=2613772 RepID=UPI0024C3EB1E|nr:MULTISPECIES: Dabb family protein [unclassified Sinorhizobium]MDK1375963.1 Dabb family protein [Sinorhizobium sp. 6-70]MDK1477566.1 Dabb family protein [Sinorhizobium sp. 6-117]